MPAALGDVFRVIAQVQQRVERSIRDHPNIAAASAIAAGRTTARHKLLPTKSRYAVSAVAALNTNLCAINKHLRKQSKATPGAKSLDLAQASRDSGVVVCTAYAEDACSCG